MAILPFSQRLVVLSREIAATSHEVKIPLRRRDAALRLLLEDVKDVDRLREVDRIHRPIGVPVMILRALQHTRPTDTTPGNPFRSFQLDAMKYSGFRVGGTMRIVL
jgi:hypothetical protein